MAEGIVNVVAKFVAKSGQEDALKRALTGLLAPSRKDPGNIAYDLYASTEQPGAYLMLETWSSQELLSKHLQSPHLTHFQEQSQSLLVAPMDVKLFSEIAG